MTNIDEIDDPAMKSAIHSMVSYIADWFIFSSSIQTLFRINDHIKITEIRSWAITHSFSNDPTEWNEEQLTLFRLTWMYNKQEIEDNL